MTLSTNQITGGNTVTGTVLLNGLAPSGGFPVSLKANLATFQLPYQISIPQGQVSTTFTVTTMETATVQNATITAQAGSETFTAVLEIDPAISRSSPIFPSHPRRPGAAPA